MHFHMVGNLASESAFDQHRSPFARSATPGGASFLDIAKDRASCSRDVRLPAFLFKHEVLMQGKNLFLDRAISRTREWQCRFPALTASGQDAGSISQGRQVVVATTSANGVRCVFFSTHGSVLDFSATWDELDRAKTWWHFVRRWNFWIVRNAAELVALQCSDNTPVGGLSLDLVLGECGDSLRLIALLEAAETHARNFIDMVPAGHLPVVDLA
jgi:hypothetical protein